MKERGIVFNVQRFTIHDGPGMRTELFLKGCPLRCPWCGNPESHRPYREPGVYKSKCISEKKCGMCMQVCGREGALVFNRGRLTSIDRDRCIRCMACADACPSDAIKQWGVEMTVDQCMSLILRDRDYYDRSGGGVTISGGEPLLQSDFVAAIFKRCRQEGIHTCCESTLHVKWDDVEKILPCTDLFISDLKHMDTDVHRKYTGAGNELLLENMKRLADTGVELILRIPVIPGVNDDDDNIKASADFIERELKGRVRTLQLLSFMRLGVEKYDSLGMPYGMRDVRFNRRSLQKRVGRIADYFNERGIHCLVGTKERS